MDWCELLHVISGKPWRHVEFWDICLGICLGVCLRGFVWVVCLGFLFGGLFEVFVWGLSVRRLCKYTRSALLINHRKLRVPQHHGFSSTPLCCIRIKRDYNVNYTRCYKGRETGVLKRWLYDTHELVNYRPYTSARVNERVLSRLPRRCREPESIL